MISCDLNQSFEEHITLLEEIDDNLKERRRNLVHELLIRLRERENEWNHTFINILDRSRQSQDEASEFEHVNGFLDITKFLPPKPIPPPPVEQKPTAFINTLQTIKESPNEALFTPNKSTICSKEQDTTDASIIEPKVDDSVKQRRKSNKEFCDPEFSNYYAVKEFMRIQELLNQNRQHYSQFISDSQTNPSYRNDLNLFIRTQINAISNSDRTHLEAKIRLLTDLFRGNQIPYQGRIIDTNRHPQAVGYCMDFAAQTFVAVGTRLVNSAPAIANSMATVITGISNNNFPMFRDYVLGHLQERCPFIIPLYPDPDDVAIAGDPGESEIRYKIACGYLVDSKSQKLELEEKYLVRIRSMVLIFACILINGPIGLAWSWLASFLSLYPEPIVTATVLQAYLQESSSKLARAYGRYNLRLITFIRSKYIPMIEQVTPKTSDRQSLIKLKNLVSEL